PCLHDLMLTLSPPPPPPQKPAAWYLCQVEKYLLRMNVETRSFVRQLREEMSYRHPRIGVHIRRSDKIEAEAKFHATSKYIKVRVGLRCPSSPCVASARRPS